MRVLLDTHAWLWWHAGDERLGPKTRAMIACPENDVLFSAVVAWEVAIKYALGRLVLRERPELLTTLKHLR